MEFNRIVLEGLNEVGAWGIVATDAVFTVTHWNAWLAHASSVSAQQAVGRNLFTLFPDLVERRLDRYYRQALGGEVAVLSQRFHRYLLPLPPSIGGPDFIYMQQSARILPFIEAGRVSGTITLIEDVTERLATEQDLRQKASVLAEAGRRKDEFLAMLAHELRNPLAPIRNAVTVLSMIGAQSAEARQACGMIERQVGHMARLIDDLLDVSRISHGKIALRSERLDLARVVRQVVDDYRSLLVDAGLSLRLTLPTAPVWVDGDATRLAQMVGNLLHNAHKFTDPGGAVEVTVGAESGHARVMVADTGIGMTPETLARLFEVFAQAEQGLARSRGGLGLGLALVKGLAELQGGSIVAASEGLGRGATFTLRLPLQTPPNTTADAMAASEKQARYRVLIIEDNRDAADSLALLLNLAGHEARAVYSGHEGVAMAREWVAQVVICDIGLPDLDGFEVARMLRADPALAGAYLMALTGYGRDEDRHDGRAAGFDVYLTKPMEFDTLRRVLAAVR